ncbi:MAG: glycosyltransferase family 4 protein [Haloarculaceae archaeon]
MHVLYVVGQNAGGLPHYTAELANAVAEHAEVTVLKPRETTADEVFGPDVEVRDAFEPLGLSLPGIYDLDVHPREVLRGIRSYGAVNAIHEIAPDVVHDATDLFPQVKFYLKRHGIDRDLPLVVTRHEVTLGRFSLDRPHQFAEELVDYAIPDLDVDRTVVHTESQKQALGERGVARDSVAVIPHGTYSLFGTHEDIADEPDGDTVLFFGHVVPHKGIDTLIRAIPRVAREVPDVTLLVAGDGTIPDDARSIVDTNRDNFEIHDRHIPNDAVQDFFERAAVVALPYHEREGKTNGHSGVLATALSFGKPVVASQAGDFPAQIDGRGCGLVVPSRDPDRLADAIVHVLTDEQARAEMARNSRQFVEELSWDAIGRRHVALYESVLDDRAGLTPAHARAGSEEAVGDPASGDDSLRTPTD